MQILNRQNDFQLLTFSQSSGKVRTENFKFRSDIGDQGMCGWSVTQQMIVYKSRLLK